MATKSRTRKTLRPAVVADYREAIIEDPQGEYAVYAREQLVKFGHDVDDLPAYDETKPIVSYGPVQADGTRPVVATYQPGEKLPTEVTAADVAATGPKASGGDTRTSRKQPAASDAQMRFIASLLADKDTTAITGGANIPQVQLDQYKAGTLSKRGASELIEWLKGRPAKSAQQGGRRATDKQVASVVREGARRDYNDPKVAATVAKATAGEPIGFAEASAALDVLFDSPFARVREERPRGKQAAAEGMYVRTENGERVFYKVQTAHHGSGREYAKKLVRNNDGTWSWDRAPGMVFQLTEADRLSLEEAQAFGKLYGVCCQCGVILTDEKSIEAGIGPICATKF